MTTNACCVWDFTAPCDKLPHDELLTFLNNHCKEWCFQKEQGATTDYVHFQGRLSLKLKKRKNELLKELKDNLLNISFSPTSNENRDNNFYAMKEDTRIEGPWTSKDVPDEPAYIPKQYRGKLETLKPFQTKVMELTNYFCDRTIHYIYCPDGNKGKSTIANLMRLHKKGIILPPINDADKLVFSACNMLRAKNVRDSVPIFIDLPRAMNQERLYGIFSAIEIIKSGYVYDTRNHYKDWDFDSPTIFVFSNIEPDFSLLSRDRWKVWTIDDNDELIRFSAKPEASVIPRESGGLAQPAQVETLYERLNVRKVKNI